MQQRLRFFAGEDIPKSNPSRRVVAAGLLVAATGACATNAGRDAGLTKILDDAVAAKRVEYALPALTACVWKDGNLLARSTDGLRASGRRTLAGADDKWHIGSCTKFMTACMTARLVARGILKWDSTLATALPPSLAPYVHRGLLSARLDQLLNHTAGIVDPSETVGRAPIPTELTQLFSDQSDLDKRSARQGALLALRNAPWRPPGEAFRYSNWGYITAGVIASQATGKSFFQLMREEVFEPLGMRGYGFGPPGFGDSLNQPWGHIAETLEACRFRPAQCLQTRRSPTSHAMSLPQDCCTYKSRSGVASSTWSYA